MIYNKLIKIYFFKTVKGVFTLAKIQKLIKRSILQKKLFKSLNIEKCKE